MNKLLIHMMNAGDIDHRILPGLQKMQKAGQVRRFTMPAIQQDFSSNDNLANPIAVRKRMEADFITKRNIDKRNALQAAQDRQGYIRQAEAPRSAASKAWAIMANPMTALKYKVHGRDIPDYFDRGEKNSLDFAVNMVNPFAAIEAVKNIPGNVARGEFINAGLNALNIIPGLKAAKTVGKFVTGAAAPTFRRAAQTAGSQLTRLSKAPSAPVQTGNIDDLTSSWGTDRWNLENHVNSTFGSPSQYKPPVINRSGLTKDELLAKAAAKEKDVVSKMSEQDFQETVLKPTGEVSSYKQDDLLNNFTGENEIFNMSADEYAEAFNSRLDLLNDIIRRNNKSGVDYTVDKLSPGGKLYFNTPKQIVPNLNKNFTEEGARKLAIFYENPGEFLTNNAGLAKLDNGKWGFPDDAELGSYASKDDAISAFKQRLDKEMGPQEISGKTDWNVNISPGQWRGTVEDIANANYYKRIPGLSITGSSDGVFSDNVVRRGSGAYNSINEYLKTLDLGRVKSGFNSQTNLSRGLWEDAVKRGNAFGYYNNSLGTVYGSMKSVLPYAIPGALGAGALSQQKYGGWNGMRNWLFNIHKQRGGPIVDPRGQWAHPGKVTRIPSSNITMQGVPYPVYGVGSNGQEQMMQPGQNYDFGGASYVDEYPMMQFGGGTLLGPSPIIMSLASKVANFFSKPNSSAGTPNKNTSSRDLYSTPYTQMNSTFFDKSEDFYNKRKANDTKKYDNSSNSINLTSGRFRGAKVAPGMINDIVNAAKANNVDPWVMLSLVGRESTFGSDKEYTNYREANNKQDLISGWNVAEDYQPYEVNRYLADKKVPGVKVVKDSHGWNYEVEDQKAIENYLKSNPQLVTDYYKKLESTPDLGKLDSFSLAAQRIKKKGIQNYNPGDPRYSSMVNSDMNLLKNDAALKKYMKNLGYREGGEFGEGLLSKTVSCSNCGWSWKAVDGGSDPLSCHKCGGTVKMQAGGQPDYNSILDQNAADAEKYPSAYHKDFVTGYPVANSAGSIPRPGGFDCPPGYTKYRNPDGTFSCIMTNPAPGSSKADVSRMTKMADDMQFSRPMRPPLASIPIRKNGGLINMQGGGQSTIDSVRHQANKILQYEQLRGGPGGAPLPQYSNPKYMDMLMGKVYPEVKKIMPNASAMEVGEAMDFVFNAGFDQGTNKITKDPRAFALQEYYRQNDPSKLDADGKWAGRKNAPYSFDQEYNNTIGKLPQNQRRILMNKGRDWYYKNINNPAPGVPNSNYNDTWFGRIWNTNDYQPFNPNNPNFTPKKEQGGTLPKMQMAGTLLQPITAQDASNVLSLFSVPQKAITKLFTGKYQTPSEAMGIKNPYGAFATDAILDPVNLVGAGILGNIAKASTKFGVLSKTYKINPLAKKKPDVILTRTQKPGQTDALRKFDEVEAKGLENPNFEERFEYKQRLKSPHLRHPFDRPGYGRGFSSDLGDIGYYSNPNIQATRGYEGFPEILKTRISAKEAEKFNVGKNPLQGYVSFAPKREYLLPKDMLYSAESFIPNKGYSAGPKGATEPGSIRDFLKKTYAEQQAANIPNWLTGYPSGKLPGLKSGGQHGGLDRWFAEKWVDVKTGKDCGRQEGEKRAGYPACRPSKRVNSQTPKTSSEMSSAEKAKFKSSKTSSQRIDYNHKRNK